MLEIIKKIIPVKLFRLLQPPYHFLMAGLASLAYRFPSERLVVIGVTGTAGKTSTAYLIYRLLSEAGYKSGLTSTALIADGEKEWLNDRKMTMPGRFFIQRLLRQMRANGCSYAVIETTSEGIKQFRHRFINYDVLVFTGIYPEHIESHGSFEKYKAAKEKLFAHLKNCRTKYVDETRQVVRPGSELRKLDLTRLEKTIIVNGDDEHAFDFLSYWSEAKIAYSLDSAAETEVFRRRLSSDAGAAGFRLVRGGIAAADATGTEIIADEHEIKLHLLGSFNAANALAAYAVGLNQGLTPERIKAGLEQVRGMAGKMEMIEAGQDFLVMVDYSFEPRALEKLYETIDAVPHNRLIQVLGSTGGGRDRSRRPVLGRMAAEKADIVIITDEDPYDEDPAQIINQVAAGAEMAGKVPNQDLYKILDRKEAITKAMSLAEAGDLVLLTGKGAEQYICLARGRKLPWDEREVARAILVDKLWVDKA